MAARAGAQPAGVSRRFRSLICKGAAAAILVCAGDAPAEPVNDVRSLPQWVLRAQERLGLQPAQQRELRALVDANAGRMRELQERLAARTDVDTRAQRDGMAALQREFRDNLAAILSPQQLAEWDALVEELLGEVHLRNAPRLAGGLH